MLSQQGTHFWNLQSPQRAAEVCCSFHCGILNLAFKHMGQGWLILMKESIYPKDTRWQGLSLGFSMRHCGCVCPQNVLFVSHPTTVWHFVLYLPVCYFWVYLSFPPPIAFFFSIFNWKIVGFRMNKCHFKGLAGNYGNVCHSFPCRDVLGRVQRTISV